VKSSSAGLFVQVMMFCCWDSSPTSTSWRRNARTKWPTNSSMIIHFWDHWQSIEVQSNGELEDNLLGCFPVDHECTSCTHTLL